ncbi:TonB-dependent hemoglobin/transferrin/lactoferrin family receptor [Brevundimonas fluminis]|jgi:hemoglobin/transferrin/lactoferrin receptor protein|uniref:TonB-dependent hemoglobin/transferrin/lactoferrin family receptor n=1 Tax=Brevundimonas fluminis TaxID=2487274 RepID=UPI000F6578FA|nr:TonB-dependent hemoglobin/transferrin/lactoferrin family receptor [Brevundimonas fluminis]
MRIRLLTTTASLAMTVLPGVALAQAQEPPVTEVAPITVSATRTAIRVDEAPATVSVITAREIEANLYTDIKDLVRFEPGVSVVSQPARFGAALGTTGRAGNEGFTIRGLGGDRVLQVVDGVRMADGFVFGAQSVGRGGYADLELMKSVEILRGPASALYGSDGVAGAVVFTTKDPSDLLVSGRDVAVRGRLGYNSADDGRTYGLSTAGRIGAFSGLIAYTTRDASETETAGTNDVEGALRTTANPQDLSSESLLAKAVWDVAPGHRLRLTYDAHESDVSANVLSGRSASVLDLRADDETRRERVAADWRFDGVLGLDRGQVTAYRQTSETRQFTFEDRTPALDRTRDNRFDNEVIGFGAEAVRTLDFAGTTHRLTFGGDWSETTQIGIRDGTVPPAGETFPSSPFPETDYRLSGLFVQDEILLMGGSLRIIPALRFDSYELTTTADPLYSGARADQSDERLSPKLGVVWWASDAFGLFGSYGAGFKAPTPSQVNNGFSNPAFGYVSVPNPDLGPETSTSVEIGARWRDLDLPGGRLAGQVVAFRSEYEDFISQQVVSGSFTPADPAVYQFVNFTEVEVSGVEARADVFWDNGFRARFSAAWAAGDQTSGTTTVPLVTIDPIKLVGGLGYDDPAGLWGGQAVLTWSDAKDPGDLAGLACAPDCYAGEAFTLLDVTLYLNVSDNAVLRAGLFNVTDESYGWWSDVRGLSGTSAVLDAYTQPGRNLSASLTFRY